MLVPGSRETGDSVLAKKFRCEFVRWGRIHRLAHRLASAIREADFRPDIIITIARGGYVPARLLCDFLDIYNLTSIRIAHYTNGVRREEQARLSSPLCIDVRGMRVLLVDDISDTGDTLQLALEHIGGFSPQVVKVAVLHHKQSSTIVPDFYAQKITKWRWITYPWAIKEDLGTFLKDMENMPQTPQEATRRLKQDYDMEVPERMLKDVYTFLQSP